VEEACFMLSPGDRMSQCSGMDNVEQGKAPVLPGKLTILLASV